MFKTSSKASFKYFLNTAALLLVLTAHEGASAKSAETTLYDFHHGSGGTLPHGALTADGSGNLFGTAEEGGGGACMDGHGCGVVFKLSPHGKETVLYAFAGGNDGAFPGGGLIVGKDGNFYGTTAGGGGSGCQAYGGCGTIFKLTPDGTESILYAFQGDSDGWQPLDSLVADANGNLYGATAYGGNFNGSDCEQIGCGAVYEIQPDGTKLTLYAFQGGNDGDAPFGGVILDSAGNIYGTTAAGGSCGCGTVFKITPDGTETLLHTFLGGDDGREPVGVTMDGAGNLFGATSEGGDCRENSGGCGTVYRLAPDGTKTALYNFQGGSDGSLPWNTLILDQGGSLYGTTFFDGKLHECKKFGGCGTVFKIAPDGTKTTLFIFSRDAGAHPYAPLLLGTNGNLYGTTTEGGKRGRGRGRGVVFRLKQ